MSNKKNSKQKNNSNAIIYTCVAIAAVCVILVALLFSGVFSAAKPGAKSTASKSESTTTAPPAPTATEFTTDYNPEPLDEAKVYYADIDIKDYGKITVKLDQKAAPVTCANFVKLANDGFYNGLTFHRIMEGFMMQGGDPLGTGTGGSDNDIVGEFSQNGHENPISHKRGVISMARSGDPNSASSQFFIVHEDSEFLDGQYAGFGEVTEGIEVVDKVCTTAEPTDNNGTIPAENQPVINTVTIRAE